MFKAVLKGVYNGPAKLRGIDVGLNFYNLYIRVKVFFQLINKGLVCLRLMKSATFNTQGVEPLCRYHKIYELFILLLL